MSTSGVASRSSASRSARVGRCSLRLRGHCDSSTGEKRVRRLSHRRREIPYAERPPNARSDARLPPGAGTRRARLVELQPSRGPGRLTRRMSESPSNALQPDALCDERALLAGRAARRHARVRGPLPSARPSSLRILPAPRARLDRGAGLRAGDIRARVAAPRRFSRRKSDRHVVAPDCAQRGARPAPAPRSRAPAPRRDRPEHAPLVRRLGHDAGPRGSDRAVARARETCSCCARSTATRTRRSGRCSA